MDCLNEFGNLICHDTVYHCKQHREMNVPQEKEELEHYSYRIIMGMIINNEIRPGEAILETELAKRLNISRTPVRQALGRLIAEGLLQKKRKRGCVIPFPTPEDGRKIFQAREIMEMEMTKLAALNRTNADIESLERILALERTSLSSGNKEEYWLANQEFHFGIMKASKNQYLEKYGNHIFRHSSIYIFFFDSFYRDTKKSKHPQNLKSPTQHEQLLQTIVKKHQNKAAELMKHHIHFSFQTLTGV